MSPKQFVNHPSEREAGADQVSRVAGCVQGWHGSRAKWDLGLCLVDLNAVLFSHS